MGEGGLTRLPVGAGLRFHVGAQDGVDARLVRGRFSSATARRRGQLGWLGGLARAPRGPGMVSRPDFQKDLPSLGMSEKSMSASRMARNRLESVAPFARVPEVVWVVLPFVVFPVTCALHTRR